MTPLCITLIDTSADHRTYQLSGIDPSTGWEFCPDDTVTIYNDQPDVYILGDDLPIRAANGIIYTAITNALGRATQ